MSLLRDFLQNLGAGLRLLAFLRLRPSHFAPSFRQIVWLGALAGAIWVVFDRLVAPDDVKLVPTGVAQMCWLAVVFVGALLVLTPAGRTPDSTAVALTALASAFPVFLLIALLIAHFAAGTPLSRWVPLLITALGAVYLYRVAILVLGSSVAVAAVTAIVVAGATWVAFKETVKTKPVIWMARDDASPSSGDSEQALFQQALQIDAAADQLAPQRPGQTDIYFVGFGGDGKQSLFATEVAFARDALSRKLDLSGRTLELVNAPQVDAQTPVATEAGLRYALQRVGKTMDVNEDVLLLFLTSHGTESAKLVIRQSAWPLQDLTAPALADALRESGVKWRVVIISACYAGSFIPALQDDYTLVVTASRADRKSFGCRSGRDLTYYGEALFRDAMPKSDSLLQAVGMAATEVSKRERAEDFEPSEPQTFVGEKMRVKLQELSFQGG